MTVEQRDKYAYELMVKNNPEEAVKQLLLKDKIIEKTQQCYDEEYNLSHKLSLELSIEKDKVFELSNHIALYSSEETMLKEINNLKVIINKTIEYIEDNVAVCAFNNKALPHWEFDDNNIQDLIKILKGGKNERNK